MNEIGVNHDWIENYTMYEAVLRCVNDIKAWDIDATIRAFMTFGWDENSKSPDELQFLHRDTGVIICFDGSVLAIQFSDGNMRDAMKDLFRVLHSLGWKLAEVFHKQSTMSALLRDMGQSISANLDFDIKPGKAGGEISSFAETAMLTKRTKEVVAQMNEVNESGLAVFSESDPVLAELKSMNPSVSALNLDSERRTLVLEDEDVPLIPVVPAVSKSSSNNTVSSVDTLILPTPTPVSYSLTETNLTIENKRLQNNLTGLYERVVTDLTLENERLKVALEKIHERIAVTEDQLIFFEKEKKQYSDHNKDLLSENTRLKNDMTKLNLENKRLQDDFIGIYERVKVTEHKLHLSENEKVDFFNSWVISVKTNENFLTEIKNNFEKLIQLEKNLSAAQVQADKVSSLEVQINQATRQAIEAQTLMSQYQRDRDALKASGEATQGDYVALKKAHEVALARLTSAEAQAAKLAVLEKDLSTAQAQAAKMVGLRNPVVLMVGE